MTSPEIKERIRREIIGVININDWTQVHAAEVAGVMAARINDIVCGRIHKTEHHPGRSLEWLIDVATRLGVRVEIHLHSEVSA